MSTARRLKVPSGRLRLKEYLAGPPDEFKTELVYGELVVSPSPTDEHQDLQFHLEDLLRRWSKPRQLGWVWHDLDIVLDELKDLVYRPDLVFLARGHENRRSQGRIFGPADLCVEILSPSDRPRLRRRKFTDYERYGVSWYWIIDPEEQTLEENHLVKDVFVCRSEVGAGDWFEPGLFPDLQFRLGPLIAGDLKAAVKGKAKKLV